MLIFLAFWNFVILPLDCTLVWAVYVMSFCKMKLYQNCCLLVSDEIKHESSGAGEIIENSSTSDKPCLCVHCYKKCSHCNRLHTHADKFMHVKLKHSVECLLLLKF